MISAARVAMPIACVIAALLLAAPASVPAQDGAPSPKALKALDELNEQLREAQEQLRKSGPPDGKRHFYGSLVKAEDWKKEFVRRAFRGKSVLGRCDFAKVIMGMSAIDEWLLEARLEAGPDFRRREIALRKLNGAVDRTNELFAYFRRCAGEPGEANEVAKKLGKIYTRINRLQKKARAHEALFTTLGSTTRSFRAMT